MTCGGGCAPQNIVPGVPGQGRPKRIVLSLLVLRKEITHHPPSRIPVFQQQFTTLRSVLCMNAMPDTMSEQLFVPTILDGRNYQRINALSFIFPFLTRSITFIPLPSHSFNSRHAALFLSYLSYTLSTYCLGSTSYHLFFEPTMFAKLLLQIRQLWFWG